MYAHPPGVHGGIGETAIMSKTPFSIQALVCVRINSRIGLQLMLSACIQLYREIFSYS